MSGRLFHGSALNGVDTKNRVSVPASFRDVIRERTGGADLFVGLGLREGSLVGYDRLYSDKLNAAHETRFGANDGIDSEDDGMSVFSSVEHLTIDTAGRVVLGAEMVGWAQLDGNALFLSAGERFFIWNPLLLLAQPNLDPRIANVAKGHLRAKGLLA